MIFVIPLNSGKKSRFKEFFSHQCKVRQSERVYPSVANELKAKSPVAASSFGAPRRISIHNRKRYKYRSKRRKKKSRKDNKLSWGVRGASRFLLHRGRRAGVTVRGLDNGVAAVRRSNQHIGAARRTYAFNLSLPRTRRAAFVATREALSRTSFDSICFDSTPRVRRARGPDRSIDRSIDRSTDRPHARRKHRLS